MRTRVGVGGCVTVKKTEQRGRRRWRRRQPTDMAFHIIEAQHSSTVTAVMAFVFLLHTPAQLVLDHLKHGQRATHAPRENAAKTAEFDRMRHPETTRRRYISPLNTHTYTRMQRYSSSHHLYQQFGQSGRLFLLFEMSGTSHIVSNTLWHRAFELCCVNTRNQLKHKAAHAKSDNREESYSYYRSFPLMSL